MARPVVPVAATGTRLAARVLNGLVLVSAAVVVAEPREDIVTVVKLDAELAGDAAEIATM